MRRLRARLWRVLAADDRHDRAARIVNGGLAAIIVTSVAATVLETVPALAARHHAAFVAIEAASLTVFTLEYLLRLWVAVEDPRYRRPIAGRVRWALTPLALVDLAAFAPGLIGGMAGVDLRWLRLARLVRLAKLTRAAPAMGLIGTVLRREAWPLATTFAVLLMLLLAAAAGIWALESTLQPEAFGSIPAAMWWAVATLTTVGYGDVVPVTAMGRAFAGLVTLVGMGMVSLPAGIIASGFVEALRERREAIEQMVDELAADGRLTREETERIEAAGEALGLDAEETDRLIRRILTRR